MAGEKILVVDDSESVREAFKLVFDEYEVITASDGKEALGILKKPNDIDLIMLDVMMPGMNGLELLEEIRKIKSGYKIVIMTAYSSKDVIVEALRLHADEYIEKPFDAEKTREAIKVLLASKDAVPAAVGKAAPPDKMKMVQRLLERNYQKGFSLKDAARDTFLNYKYCSRIFKERVGKNFNAYKLELKISSAKELLRKSGCKVSEIAYKVGYHNPDSFMKMFKKVTGMTPSQYRLGKKEERNHPA
jgi:two-component system, response regulator YesN